ncbi:OOP family OmpA-OmpF porin [Natronocella acetinitrilica]|uniref:OOP family OmpA-OmpF porin n=1 Tax=Natronocella acetinitrilica TaxID=414046 RepID=A0AAE3G0X7_9GAMM|nr:OmpA family protein [Natronocella acetinitrilica]MCP1673591.1 OOP family OmpA-OmpF porin [Natronocella acetinitrilica]
MATGIKGLGVLFCAGMGAMLLGSISAQALAEGDRSKYWIEPNSGEVWRLNGQCLTVPGWTESDAIAECHPELADAAAAPQAQPRVETRFETESASALFGFNDSQLTNQGREAMRRAVRTAEGERIERVRVVGHADRIGRSDFNDRLSMARARTVSEYLGSLSTLQGVEIEHEGVGYRVPVVDCDEQARDALIECLAPNRRVELEITVRREVPVQQ